VTLSFFGDEDEVEPTRTGVEGLTALRLTDSPSLVVVSPSTFSSVIDSLAVSFVGSEGGGMRLRAYSRSR
jgi:hypothetical protein